MEDQDRETRTDEEVEGHMHKNAPAASHKLANDEGDDVEAHQNKNVHLEPSEVNLATDEDDDVEGHMNKNAVNKGMHKNRNLGPDEDDVEAHVHLNAVNKGMHKN